MFHPGFRTSRDTGVAEARDDPVVHNEGGDAEADRDHLAHDRCAATRPNQGSEHAEGKSVS